MSLVYELFSPAPGREGLEAYNADLAPAEVARLIAAHYHLPSA